MKSTFKLGQWNAICDVCGFQYKSGQLRERWDGLMVCDKDWEERHPSDFFRAPPPEEPIPWSTGEPTDASGTDVDGDVIPPTYTITPDAVPDGTFDDNNGTL